MVLLLLRTIVTHLSFSERRAIATLSFMLSCQPVINVVIV